MFSQFAIRERSSGLWLNKHYELQFGKFGVKTRLYQTSKLAQTSIKKIISSLDYTRKDVNWHSWVLNGEVIAGCQQGLDVILECNRVRYTPLPVPSRIALPDLEVVEFELVEKK